MHATGLIQHQKLKIPAGPGSHCRKIMAGIAFIAVISAGSCYDDSSNKKSITDILSLDSIISADDTDILNGLEAPDQSIIPDDTGGTITFSFNVPSMRNARVYGLIFDAKGVFRGEIGYNDSRNLKNGISTLIAHRASGNYSRISTDTNELFPDGIYTIHGKFDVSSNGFDKDQGDKGFRVNFAVNGDTTLTIEDADLLDPCFELITSTGRQDLKFATVYAYMYFPGGDPLRNYAYRFDGGSSFVKLNHLGNDLGNTMTEDLNTGVYDVLIIADMDDSIDDPDRPFLSNGDKYAVVKKMLIDGTDPIDISGYGFTTYIADILPAPKVYLQLSLNAITITVTNMAGAESYNVYGRSADGYSLIGTIANNDGDEHSYFNDFGPDNEYDTSGLPANTDFYYRVAAVKSNGLEGEPGQWVVMKSGDVQKPEIYGQTAVSSTRLDLHVAIPRYCREIEITAMSAACNGPQIEKFSFSVSHEQREKGIHVSLTDFPMEQDMTYAFTVRGKDMHGDWSEPSSCYLFAY